MLFYENYERNNLWALIRIKRRLLGIDKDEKIEIADYISSILQPKYIYRFLKNTISISSGNDGYSYYFSDENFECFLNKDSIVKVIDSNIQNNPPQNDTELLLVKVYEAYKNGEKDVWGHNSYRSDTFIKLL